MYQIGKNILLSLLFASSYLTGSAVYAQQATKVLTQRYAQSNYTIPPGSEQVSFGNGLKGSFYKGTAFDQYVGSRIDQSLDFDWSDEPPLEGMSTTQFSARYEGWLYIPETGKYTFYAYVDDGIRIWLDDKLLFDQWQGQYPTEFKRKFSILGGRFYKLKIEYMQLNYTAFLRLSWKFEDEKKKVISNESLFTDLEQTVVANVVKAERGPDEVQNDQVAATTKTAEPTEKSETQTKVNKPARMSVNSKPPESNTSSILPNESAISQPQKEEQKQEISQARLVSVNDQPLKTSDKLLLDAVYFQRGKSKLNKESLPQLDELVDLLKQQTSLKIMVVGHTDNVGDPKKNLKLSMKRAEAVCIYLQSEGIPKNRLLFRGAGGLEPAYPNDSEKNKKKNRRVEFVVLSI